MLYLLAAFGHKTNKMNRAYLWKPPHSYYFPRPYAAEEIDMNIEDLSPFSYTIDMDKETTKSTAVSLMKNLDWLHSKRESQPFPTSTGQDYFAAEKSQRKRALQKSEQKEWEDLIGAASNLTRLKTKDDARRARFTSPPTKKKRKVYRKTPPFNPSLHTYSASPRSSPCLASSSPLSSAPQPSEQTSQSKNCV